MKSTTRLILELQLQLCIVVEATLLHIVIGSSSRLLKYGKGAVALSGR